jgi:hypothetical protein
MLPTGPVITVKEVIPRLQETPANGPEFFEPGDGE